MKFKWLTQTETYFFIIDWHDNNFANSTYPGICFHYILIPPLPFQGKKGWSFVIHLATHTPAFFLFYHLHKLTNRMSTHSTLSILDICWYCKPETSFVDSNILLQLKIIYEINRSDSSRYVTWVCSKAPLQNSFLEVSENATHSLSLFCFPLPHVFEHSVQEDHSVNTGHLSSLHFSVSLKGALQGLSFDFADGSNPHIRLLDLSPPLHVKLQSVHSDHGPSSKTECFCRRQSFM